MLQRVRKLKEKVPSLFDLEVVAERFPVSYEDSLNNVLRLEVTRYNNLLAQIHSSLNQLEKALKGEIVMSADLEMTYDSLLFKNELAENWKTAVFYTEANLRDFLRDLQKRCDFFKKWIDGTIHNKYWLRAFFLPQAFLTAIQLNYARRLKEVCSTK